MVDLILNPHFVTLAFVLLAVGTPAGGVITLTLVSKPEGERLKRLAFFYLLVVSGPLLGIMWVLFNFIEDSLGLDSILALLLNLCLFCVIGLGIGAFLKFPPQMLRKESATVSASARVGENSIVESKENTHPDEAKKKTSND